MTAENTSPTSTPGLPWLLIVGLSCLALLWPLTNLIGFSGGAPRAILLVVIIAAVWIGVVGFARVPNPVAVLTLTGIGHGVITLIVSAIVGGATRPIWVYAMSLGVDAFWGAMAGLVALAIQAMIGRSGAGR